MTLWNHYFPRTFELLAEQSQVYIETYLQEMGMALDKNLKEEDLRYFAGFVRQKSGQHKLLSEVARWEGAHCLLQTLELDFKTRGDEGTVFIAPSLQTLPLFLAAEVFDKKPGLYALIKYQSQIREQLLEPFEAQILDLLQEDRKFTPEQLLQMAELESGDLPKDFAPLTVPEREQRLRKLFEVGILQVVRTKEML